MQPIQAILFDPVGCLAEFASEPFLEMAFQIFGRPKRPSRSASRTYWHLLNLADGAESELTEVAVALELEAVNGATLYEDVVPALSELTAMGIRLFIATSLSAAATGCFLNQHSLNELFSAVWTRDTAGGVKAAPLRAAISGACLNPKGTMFLTDTSVGLMVAKSVGVNPILMMNDPDEAKRLAVEEPAGGIVSLHELPDFIRLVAAENARPPRS